MYRNVCCLMVNDGYNVPFAFLSDCAKYLQGETRIQKF